MPIDIRTINNVKTKKNIEKFNIDVSNFDDIKELRKHIQLLQNKDRLQALKKKREEALTSQEPPSLETINKHAKKSIEKYNIDISNFKTKGELLSHLRQLAMKSYLDKNRDKINSYYREKARETKIRKQLGFEMPADLKFTTQISVS